MNIVILGAGALETVLGAHLVRAGEAVTLAARGHRAATLQEHGATLVGLADFSVPVSVITDPQQVQEADVLIVTVKTYDTASALASVKHIRVDSVLSLQNGVLKDEQLAHIFGWQKVIGAMAVFSAGASAIHLARPGTGKTSRSGSDTGLCYAARGETWCANPHHQDVLPSDHGNRPLSLGKGGDHAEQRDYLHDPEE